jgi:hypothetical protein
LQYVEVKHILDLDHVSPLPTTPSLFLAPPHLEQKLFCPYL